MTVSSSLKAAHVARQDVNNCPELAPDARTPPKVTPPWAHHIYLLDLTGPSVHSVIVTCLVTKMRTADCHT